jgi:hypothetical protein
MKGRQKWWPLLFLGHVQQREELNGPLTRAPSGQQEVTFNLNCTSSKDSGLRGFGFKRGFQLIRFMVMQPSLGSIADVAQPALSA